MRIAIIGAGAMGSVYAYLLSSRNEVLLADVSEKRVNDINTNGLRIRHGDRLDVRRCEAVCSAAGQEPAELVLLFVKTMYTEDALRGYSELIGEGTVLLSLQNGYGAWKRIAAVFPDAQILCGTSMHGATMLQNGVVDHTACGLTCIGCVSGGEPPQALAREFEACGLPTQAVDRVVQSIWRKVIINCGINGITALMRSDNGFFAEQPQARALSERVVREAVAIANADGCEFDESELLAAVHQTAVTTGRNLSSMLQDVLARRRMETDSIYGSVLEAANAHGVSAPHLETVYMLLKSAEAAILQGRALHGEDKQ